MLDETLEVLGSNILIYLNLISTLMVLKRRKTRRKSSELWLCPSLPTLKSLLLKHLSTNQPEDDLWVDWRWPAALTVASSCDHAPCWPPFVSALFYSCAFFFLLLLLLSVLSPPPPPLPLFPGQISLAPWGQMRRPSWPMCRVTTTRSRASRRWEMKRKGKTIKQSPDTCQQWLLENDSRVLPTFRFWLFTYETIIELQQWP